MDSMGAFMSGKMKISGEMTVAMKLSSLFGQYFVRMRRVELPRLK